MFFGCYRQWPSISTSGFSFNFLSSKIFNGPHEKKEKNRKKISLQADVGMFWSRFVYHLLKSGTKDASEREPRARFGSAVASCSSFIRLQSGDTRDRQTDRHGG